MSQYAEAAERLITREPDCQRRQPHQPEAPCEPGCIHEQLNVARAQVYAQLETHSYLDAIAAELSSIASHQ
jgi:hypothetical protein